MTDETSTIYYDDAGVFLAQGTPYQLAQQVYELREALRAMVGVHTSEDYINVERRGKAILDQHRGNRPEKLRGVP